MNLDGIVLLAQGELWKGRREDRLLFVYQRERGYIGYAENRIAWRIVAPQTWLERECIDTGIREPIETPTRDGIIIPMTAALERAWKEQRDEGHTRGKK